MDTKAAVALATNEIKEAWENYQIADRQATKYGLEFGRKNYEWRERFKSKAGCKSKGQGITAIWQQLEIPERSAFRWIERYEIFIGLREPDPPEFEQAGEDFEAPSRGGAKQYWLTPPEIYKKLDEEFHFDHDPCPYPLPPGFDGLKGDWGKVNYVNPPFCRDDCKGNVGMTAWARKVVAEQAKGRTSVVVLPAYSYMSVLAHAGAEMRDL